MNFEEIVNYINLENIDQLKNLDQYILSGYSKEISDEIIVNNEYEIYNIIDDLIPNDWYCMIPNIAIMNLEFIQWLITNKLEKFKKIFSPERDNRSNSSNLLSNHIYIHPLFRKDITINKLVYETLESLGKNTQEYRYYINILGRVIYSYYEINDLDVYLYLINIYKNNFISDNDLDLNIQNKDLNIQNKDPNINKDMFYTYILHNIICYSVNVNTINKYINLIEITKLELSTMLTKNWNIFENICGYKYIEKLDKIEKLDQKIYEKFDIIKWYIDNSLPNLITSSNSKVIFIAACSSQNLKIAKYIYNIIINNKIKFEKFVLVSVIDNLMWKTFYSNALVENSELEYIIYELINLGIKPSNYNNNVTKKYIEYYKKIHFFIPLEN